MILSKGSALDELAIMEKDWVDVWKGGGLLGWMKLHAWVWKGRKHLLDFTVHGKGRIERNTKRFTGAFVLKMTRNAETTIHKSNISHSWVFVCFT
mmetsp:Transcript_16293/g.35345  ORF Transcript_16293/g.35345 Transcript_16293/m.35345 type:complete len:95 (-) Transcript_16293:388-672(-)